MFSHLDKITIIGNHIKNRRRFHIKQTIITHRLSGGQNFAGALGRQGGGKVGARVDVEVRQEEHDGDQGGGQGVDPGGQGGGHGAEDGQVGVGQGEKVGQDGAHHEGWDGNGKEYKRQEK